MPCLLLHVLNETTENTSGRGKKGIQIFHEEIKRYAHKKKKKGKRGWRKLHAKQEKATSRDVLG